MLQTTGDNNTAIGTHALENLLTGSDNIALGSAAGSALTTSESNNIDIGSNGVVGDSGTIRIGTVGTHTAAFMSGVVTTIGTGTSVVVTPSGQLIITASSRRYKDNIEDMKEQSSAILDLRPVSFTYKSDPTQTKLFGLIAEEVYDVLPSLVTRNIDGQIETVKYHELATLLLNELIKQHAVIEKQKKQ